MAKEVVLSIKGLNKTIGKKQILHNINMECYSGEVFGFLGPNGAGKTTTIKIVVGLLSLEEGVVKICGNNITEEFERAMANVGGIVENPEMYKYMSGMDNLKQYARMRGIKDQALLDEAVALVKLSNRINDKVSKYSLGMRQRLGVAQALIHKPKLLILDEPTNGLDPQGIKELRDILKDLAHNSGTCVVVSSHLMSEMELMCDRVGIIKEGAMIGTYTMDEISFGMGGEYEEYIIETDYAKAAAKFLELSQERIVCDNTTLTLKLDHKNSKEEIAKITKTLCSNDINIYSIQRHDTKSLEDVFIELTNNVEGDDQIV